MSVMTSASFLCLVVFASVIIGGSLVSAADLQCYLCLANCDDPFVESAWSGNTSCAQGSCIKTKANSGHVLRFCSLLRYKDGCEEKDHETSCACSENWCNHGNRPAPPGGPMILVVAATAVAFVMMRAGRFRSQ